MKSNGVPARLNWCDWASRDRLVCELYGISAVEKPFLVGYTRLFAMGADGAAMKLLGQRDSVDSLGPRQWDGNILAWGADDGRVLMERNKVPEATTGSRLGEGNDGLAVEWVDGRTTASAVVERPRPDAGYYIADPAGEVRVMRQIVRDTTTYQLRDEKRFFYRTKGSRDWQRFIVPGTEPGDYTPVAYDAPTDSVYAWRKKDGRDALYRISLDGRFTVVEVASSPVADIDSALRFGRLGRIVGADVVTDKRQSIWFDPEIKRLAASLGKAIPNLPLIEFLAASRDEQRVLLLAHADNDPGRYYVFDRKMRGLNEVMLARPQLEGVKLATVRPISFPAADGTMIPGYLTLPPEGAGRNLPAIVMPHGGPSARDEWGFDWWAQYYAHLGYAVLQPNFRGSAGYGDKWFGDKGFRGWATAVGDINAAGRWLSAQGIAASGRMAIVGWSYGGYAALQSQVVDPALFQAVVAVAPVTDFRRVIEESRGFTNRSLVIKEVGGGDHLVAGSPVNFPAKFQAPVLMFSGDRDLNVGIGQSQAMDRALRGAGKSSRLVTYEGLDHQLLDSAARADMLRQSSAFLKDALKL